VRFDIARLHDDGTFSTRRITATQAREVLIEGLASFTAAVDSVTYQAVMPDAPTPESLIRSRNNLRRTPTSSVAGGLPSARSTFVMSIRRRAAPWTRPNRPDRGVGSGCGPGAPFRPPPW